VKARGSAGTDEKSFIRTDEDLEVMAMKDIDACLDNVVDDDDDENVVKQLQP